MIDQNSQWNLAIVSEGLSIMIWGAMKCEGNWLIGWQLEDASARSRVKGLTQLTPTISDADGASYVRSYEYVQMNTH